MSPSSRVSNGISWAQVLISKRHAADHGRAELGAGDHVALGVGERAGEVEALVEDRRVGRLHQQDAHLAADRHHGGVEDAHHDGVGLAGALRADDLVLDRQAGLDDGEADVAGLAVGERRPLDAPGRAVDAGLAVAGAGECPRHRPACRRSRTSRSARCSSRWRKSASAQAPAIRRWPQASTVRRWPGSTTVTEAVSSISAGPMSAWPARRSSRR